jgi:hypothetical protein
LQSKLIQSISKQESFNILDHLLFEERIGIESYECLVTELRSFDSNREILLELVLDEPVAVHIKY